MKFPSSRFSMRDPAEGSEDMGPTEGVRFRAGKLKGDDAFTIQGVVFAADKWDLARARAWMHDHGFWATDRFSNADESIVFPIRDERDFAADSIKAFSGADVALFEDLHAIDGVEVFRTGTWNGDRYDAKDLDDMVAAFDAVGFQPPVKLGHDEKSGDRAYGWVERIYRVGDRLVADLKDIPQHLYELIRDRAYDHISSEIFFNLKRGGKTFRRALKAIALLGAETPAVAGLKPIREAVFAAGFAGQSARSYTEWRATMATLPTDLAGLKAERDRLKGKIAEMKAKPEAADEVAQLSERLVEAADKIAELSEAGSNADRVDPVEFRRLKEQLAEQTRISAEMLAREKRNTIAEKVKGVKVPALRDHVAALYELADLTGTKTVKFKLGNSEKAADTDPTRIIDDLVDRLNERVGSLFSTRTVGGDAARGDDDDDVDAGAKLTELANAMVRSGNAKTFSEAFAAVRRDPKNAGLVERYAAAG